MLEILKTIRLFFSMGIPFFVRLIPRKKNIWIYGGRSGKFVDNTKYWFLWTNENLPDIKHVWISSDKNTIKNLRDRGFLAYPPFSRKGFCCLLRGKIAFYSHGATSIVKPVFLEGAVKFDFFHGIPFKTLRVEKTKTYLTILEKDFKYGISKRLFNYYKKRYYANDFIVIPSKLHEEQFEDHTGERLFFGYPRNIVFQNSKDENRQLIESSESKKRLFNDIAGYNRKFIYMPTFREGTPDFLERAFPHIEQLNEIMRVQNSIFLLKLHPYTKTKLDFSRYSHLKIVDNEIDVYPFLPFIDCLISDYSSISMDFYFAEKPIIFYLFDFDEFITESRDMDFHPGSLAPDSTAMNWEKFIHLIEKVETIPLLSHQQGRGHFQSHLKPDMQQIADYVCKDILKI